MKNYYEILGVNKYASVGQIRNAYVDKIKSLHPDKTDNYSEDNVYELKAVNEAYKTLKDPLRRYEYNAKITKSNPTVFYDRADFFYPENTFTDFEYFKKYNKIVIFAWVVLGFLVSLILYTIFSLDSFKVNSNLNNSNIQNEIVPKNKNENPSELYKNDSYEIKPKEI